MGGAIRGQHTRIANATLERMATLVRMHSIDCLHDLAEDVGYRTCEVKKNLRGTTDIQSVAEALKHESVLIGNGEQLYPSGSRSRFAGCHSSVSSDCEGINGQLNRQVTRE